MQQIDRNPRAYIDLNGGYQTPREGVDKEAHDAWMKTTSWNLSRDDFIRLSFFHGDLKQGDDGLPSKAHPINGSTFKPYDVVYINEEGAILTRSAISYWLNDCSSFVKGFKEARKIS